MLSVVVHAPLPYLLAVVSAVGTGAAGLCGNQTTEHASGMSHVLIPALSSIEAIEVRHQCERMQT
jgi:hypothetical protein